MAKAVRPGLILLITGPLLIWSLAACQAAQLAPPRLATATAMSAELVPPTGTPLLMAAPTATPGNSAGIATPLPAPGHIEVWVNETSGEHEQALQAMSTAFTAESGISVSFRLVSPDLLPDLVNTAVLSDTLPDIVLHPVEYTMGWTQSGILDASAADSTIDAVGRESFNPNALALVDHEGEAAAVPSDGYHQIWLYRADWAEDLGLPEPNTFDRMFGAAEAFFDPEQITTGLVAPTESNLVNTQRAFEQFALANGCQLIDEAGELRLLDAACGDALDFYFEIIHNFSPAGVQTNISASNAYLEGRTGIIMASPSILSAVAAEGLDENTGIITSLRGRGREAQESSFSNLTYLGITKDADREAAAEFITFWLNEGYETWLDVDAERKVPLRWGDASDNGRFIERWGSTPIFQDKSLLDIYGQEIVSLLSDNLGEGSRWALSQGQGPLLTDLYQNLTLSVVLQEMLSGYFGSAQTLFEAGNRVIGLIPNYSFEIVPSPTPLGEEE